MFFEALKQTVMMTQLFGLALRLSDRKREKRDVSSQVTGREE